MAETAMTSLALTVAAVAACTDALRGRIPNVLTFPTIAGALVLHAAGGSGNFGRAVLGLVISASLPWVLYQATRGQAIGGGDVKLFTGLGALLGPVTGLEVELSAFMLLAMFAVLRLAFEGRLTRVIVNAGFLLANPILPERHRRSIVPEALTAMRLGPAIFVAVVTVTIADVLGRHLPWL